jgi:hypothetical protein
MGMKSGNKKAGSGAGSLKMGGPGRKPTGRAMPSDNDGDEGMMAPGAGSGPAFKKGGKVQACAKGGVIAFGKKNAKDGPAPKHSDRQDDGKNDKKGGANDTMTRGKKAPGKGGNFKV